MALTPCSYRVFESIHERLQWVPEVGSVHPIIPDPRSTIPVESQRPRHISQILPLSCHQCQQMAGPEASRWEAIPMPIPIGNRVPADIHDLIRDIGNPDELCKCAFPFFPIPPRLDPSDFQWPTNGLPDPFLCRSGFPLRQKEPLSIPY